MNTDTTRVVVVDELQCPICLNDIPSGHRVTTKCGHGFCSECIYEWVSRKKICPLCRAPDPLQHLRVPMVSGLIELGQTAIARNGRLLSRSGARIVVRTPETLLTIIRGKTVLRFKRRQVTNVRIDPSRSRILIQSVSTPTLCRPACTIVEYILDPGILHAFARFVHEWWLN